MGIVPRKKGDIPRMNEGDGRDTTRRMGAPQVDSGEMEKSDVPPADTDHMMESIDIQVDTVTHPLALKEELPLMAIEDEPPLDIIRMIEFDDWRDKAPMMRKESLPIVDANLTPKITGTAVVIGVMRPTRAIVQRGVWVVLGAKDRMKPIDVAGDHMMGNTKQTEWVGMIRNVIHLVIMKGVKGSNRVNRLVEGGKNATENVLMGQHVANLIAMDVPGGDVSDLGMRKLVTGRDCENRVQGVMKLKACVL